mgnify:FL=1
MKEKQIMYALAAVLCIGTAAAAVLWDESANKQRPSVEQQNTLPQTENQTEPVTSAKTKTVAETAQEEMETTAQEPQTSAALPEAEEEVAFALPVDGEILMAYSPDHAIYDPTLDQYHTSDSVSLKAAQDSAVTAAAGGTVASVATEDGGNTTVTLVHENGWQTTYGQLKDVALTEGEWVKPGQTIGLVAKADRASTALGDHVEFAMTDETGASVDPMAYAAQ